MTSKKLSQLPGAAALAGAEILAGLQSGGDVGVTPAQIATYMAPQIASAVAGNALTNINTLATSKFVTDGVTSNAAKFQSLAPVLQGICPEMPVPVNFAVGSPTVLSINPTTPSGGTLTSPSLHYFKPNQAFFFYPDPAVVLPAGVSFNTLYYITSANLTGTTFTFSLVNNYGPTIGEGGTVNTTGSLTGTARIVLTGRDVNLFIPPGPYFGGNILDSNPNVTVTPNGITRIRYFAYGAIFDVKTSFGAPLNNLARADTWFPEFDYINTTPNENVVPTIDLVVRLQTTANAVNYWIGQWVSLFGLNIQDPFGHLVSGPPNYHYQEYMRIKAVNTGTGDITFDGPSKWVYLSTFPNLFTPSIFQVGGGTAMMVPMHPSWDTEIEVHGPRWYGECIDGSARRFLWKDCTFQGFGNAPGQTVPTVAQSATFRNCRFGVGGGPAGGSFMEVDKMLEYLEIDDCDGFNKYSILFPSSSVQVANIKSYKGSNILGTPRQMRIEDSEVDEITVGPQLGVADSLQIQNSRIQYFDLLNRPDDNNFIQPAQDMVLVPNWTFASGIFTRNISALPGNQAMRWMIPGAKIYMTDAGNVFKYYQNMGSPFAILNVYMDGSGNFSFETTLTAVPTRQTSHTATITVAAPGVVTWASHGLAAGTPVCFTTTGALPTGLLNSTLYYVANDGNLATNTFAVSDTVAHANAGTNQITTTGTQSGTHTAYGNPLCFRPHPCARFTGIGNVGCSSITDQNGSIDEPLFSRVRRAFVGKQSITNPQGFQQPNPRIWGFLRSLTVTVRKAGTASGTMTISCPGFTQPNLALSNFSQVIDTTVAGTRSWIGSAAPTGPGGSSDTIAAYADWVSGPLIFTFSAGVTLPNSPLVEFEMTTDQGITRFGNMIGAPASPSSASVWQWNDSGIIQQFGSSP